MVAEMDRVDLIPRVFAKTSSSGPDECWVWRGGTREGRPVMYVKPGKSYAAPHRLLFEEQHGPIGREVILRQCDQSRCINPAHYRLSRRVLGLPPKERPSAEKQRKWNLRRYGITPDDYDALLAIQENVCAVCHSVNQDKLGRRLHVDHCHESGRVRGLLCTLCNNAIGHAGDDPERLRALADYLDGSALSR